MQKERLQKFAFAYILVGYPNMRREALREQDMQMCKMCKLRSCGVAGRSGTLCLRVVVELPHWLQKQVGFGSGLRLSFNEY